ncbi:hypothetical protein DB88DRAFT_473734 [Papiliotrema laurentii]|uniref:FAS1 domain-containing protein n=1 Tax=Papiliotrema laurentii TaxID=5418 RepID=A0AAD9CVZ4_PAPLA|nr:hypothetical protein DB88DRAFT_473734 [Papiliotrema laurentii]
MKFTSALLSTALLAALALAQSEAASSASSAASGASSAAASAAPSGSGGNSTNGTDYLSQVLGALTGAGLTSLVSVATSIANTTEGQALLGQLAGGNKTVFAPNNEAFAAVPESVSSNTTLLTEILSYHILNNTYSGSGIATAPNHTIARTLLRGGEFELPGNRTAPLVLERESANATGFRIVQGNITNAQNPASAANLQVYVIDRVLDLPANLSTVATAAVPALASLIQQANLLEPLESAVGITVFAPSDSAIQGVAGAVGQLNQTQIQTILANHVVNGTVAYSTSIGTTNLTSAAGEPFTFTTNSSGTYVHSGNATAKITATDIIINNGVVHLIDNVLVNTNSNQTAANNAYSSATAAAATQTEPTGAITSSPAATSNAGGASGSSGPSGAAGQLEPMGLTGSMIGGAVGVLLAVAGGAFTLF